MQITLNQQPRTIVPGMTLLELMQGEGLASGHVAVAINRRIIARELWSETELREGDTLLIVGAIKGG